VPQQTMPPTILSSRRQDDGIHPSRRSPALAIIVICQLMLILDATVMNVALPRIQQGLGFSPTSLAWVLNSYTLTFGGLLLLGGRAGDIFGRRRLFIVGLAVFTAASLAGGFATTPALLIAARVLQGIGAAMAGPSTIALITTTYTEPRARIRALALLSAVATGGFAIGLILGGVLTELASWRWVLFINVPFGLAAVLLAPRFIREPERHPARLDLPGAILGTAGIAALVFGFVRAASHGWAQVWTIAPMAAGVALLAAFIAVEARTPQPLMPLRLFAHRNRAAGYLAFLLGPAGMMSMFFFLTQFLQTVRGFGALATGFAFLPMAVGMFSMTRVIPRALPRFGPRPLAVTGNVLMIAGLVLLTRLTPETAYWPQVFVAMLIMGVGGGLGFSPLMPTIMGSVPPKDTGIAGGVVQTMQQTGATLGLAVLVTVFGTAYRHTGSLVPAMTSAFGFSCAFAAAALLVALTLTSTPKQAVESSDQTGR
jgi:EmrB/QacA subfamily drug resistance transporter